MSNRRQRTYTTPQWHLLFNKREWKIATLKLSGSHREQPNQSMTLRYGWHPGNKHRKDTFYVQCVIYGLYVPLWLECVYMFSYVCLAAGHHMFVEQNIACSALSGKFNKSHTGSLLGMDGKYPIFQPQGQRSHCHRLSNTRCWQSADVLR